MLPSMPILFTRDSQDAFGNKTNPSTSFFVQNSPPKTFTIPEPPLENVQRPLPVAKQKINAKKKERLPVDPPKTDENALELALVRTFYTKVQSRFASNQAVPTNKFVQFHNILKTFDPFKETPVDLYRKIEQLFGDKHKDLVEEFLLFLNPGQAAQVGRFMDHFSYAQMINFIGMLQCTFARKPTVLRKILRALTTGLSAGGGAAVRARVVPHLRSSPRLAQLFNSLLPDERPPDTLYQADSDTMNEDMLTNDKGYDVWEFDDEADGKKKLDAKERLDTAYLHGRVFLQHGRILRAASVTYPYSKEPYRVHAHRLTSTHGHSPHSPPESDEERSSPKRNTKTSSKIPPKRTKKQVKSPTKNIKDVNDNTRNKDCPVNVTNSPKTARSKTATAKSKSNKQKETDSKTCGALNKKDRKVNEKNDEGALKVKPIKIETPVMQADKPELKGNSWTREEDKTMLQVLKGEARSEQVFGRIKELLPHRSPVEIKERFCHVMNLLQQMAVGEVT